MRKWRVWQGSTEIQGDMQYGNLIHQVSAMADADISLSDPDFDFTVTTGSNLNVFEGGNEIYGDNCGMGAPPQTDFATSHGTMQSNYMKLYVDGTGAGDEISYTRVDIIDFSQGLITLNIGSTVEAGSTLYADYIYNGTGLFRGEIESFDISSNFNQKIINLRGRNNLLDAAYKSLLGGSWSMGWTNVTDELVGTGNGTTLVFNLAHGSVAEDSLVLTTGSQAGVMEGTASLSDSRLESVSYANGTITFYGGGNALADGSALNANYRYASGSTVELMARKVAGMVSYSCNGTTIPATGVTAMADVRGITAFDAFKKLVEICGSAYEAEFWLDAEDEMFYFRDTESSGSAYTRDDFKQPNGNVYTEDATDSYTKVVLYYQSDVKSITKGAGSKALVIHDRYCRYQQEAEEKAKYYYRVNSASKTMGRCVLKDWTSSQKLNNTISITDSATGQSAGSYIIKTINRAYSIDNRNGEITFQYGAVPVQWADVMKQGRELADYRENEMERDLRVTSASELDHEELSGLLGGAADDHYHVTGTQHTYITGTTTKSMFINFSKASGPNDSIYDMALWRANENDVGAYDIMVPSDYVTGSFAVTAYILQEWPLVVTGSSCTFEIWTDKFVDGAPTGTNWVQAGRVSKAIAGGGTQYYTVDMGDCGTYGMSVGDLVRLRFYRWGTAATDDYPKYIIVHGIKVEYTGRYIL